MSRQTASKTIAGKPVGAVGYGLMGEPPDNEEMTPS